MHFNPKSYATKKPGEHFLPCRTFAELCAEFNIDRHKLLGLMQRFNGPKPVVKHNKSGMSVTSYYEYKGFKQWWNSIPKEELEK